MIEEGESVPKFTINDADQAIVGKVNWKLFEADNLEQSGSVNATNGEVEVDLSNLKIGTEYKFVTEFDYDILDGKDSQVYTNSTNFTTLDSLDLIIDSFRGITSTLVDD